MNAPLKIYEPYCIVIVPFPFTDKTASKRRPAVVLNTAEAQRSSGSVLCAMITTTRHIWPGLDIPITDLESAGLPKKSKIRLKLFTLDHGLILEERGLLSKQDQTCLKQQLRHTCALEEIL